MKKRVNTASWNEKKKHWRIDVQKDSDRRTFYSSTPGRAGQREANAKADKWLEEGTADDSRKIGSLICEYLTQLKGTSKKENYDNIESALKTWFYPDLSKKRMNKLCDGDVQLILDKMNSKGRSKKTIKNTKSYFGQFLIWCRQNNYTNYSMRSVHIPAGARIKTKNILQPEDIEKLFRIDTTVYNKKRIVDPNIYSYRFALLTGLRPGELRALKWENIKGRKVTVTDAINVNGRHSGGKNQNAIRSFIMSDQAYMVLRSQKEKYPSDDYIFDLPEYSTYYKQWYRYCASNDITHISLYELRHSFVSIAKQLPEGIAKDIVGHSENMDTFGVYGHLFNGDDERAAEAVTGLFSRLVSSEITPLQKIKDDLTTKLHGLGASAEDMDEINFLINSLVTGQKKKQ